MESELTQLGIGGILVILVLREVFSFVGKKRTNGPSIPQHCAYCQKTLDKLADMEGVQINLLRDIHTSVERHEERTEHRTGMIKEKFQEVKGCLNDIKQVFLNGGQQHP